ncbi:hypothetical protein [Bacillus sp. E214]|uniref:hypothetical protein n=1 Tax=Bacillus sp. E214 TaxID=2587156 RepID=UPI0011DFE8B9|nr:hypothetical protein [Bacillus sp. E214]
MIKGLLRILSLIATVLVLMWIFDLVFKDIPSKNFIDVAVLMGIGGAIGVTIRIAIDRAKKS